MIFADTRSGGPVRRAAPFLFTGAPYAVAIALYGAVNVPFVYKYGARAGLPAAACVVGYVVFVAAIGVLLPRIARWLAVRRSAGTWYAATALTAAAVLAGVMSRFDPELIRVTRAPAVHEWLDHVLHGRFPYASDALPSAFPFMFAVALPFDRLGDVGWLQIVALPAFAALCWSAARGVPERAWTALGLLLAAPLFLYEVVTRSELFSNMTLLLAVLVAMESAPLRLGAVGSGIAAGLVLSTRAIVGLAYLAFAGWRFRREPATGLLWGAVTAITFVATWLPFALWDSDRFARFGPFAIQASYAPAWLIAAFGLFAAILGWTSRNAEHAHARVASVLFALVGVVFLSALRELGWTTTLLDDRFDISYFAFGHTTLLYGVARGAWSTPAATPESGR